MKTRILYATAFVSVVSVSGACTPARIAVPADLAKEAEEIQVTDRSRMTGALANESFKMGSFQITDVDRKWNSSSGFTIGRFSSEGKKTGYSFTFKGPGGEAKVKCASEHVNKEAKLFGGSIGTSAATIGCQCEGPGAQAELVLSTNEFNTYSGQAQTRGGAYSVTAIDKCETGSCGVSPAGYDIRAQSAAGAFEIFHPGRLWLARSLAADARADLACLAAGVMLYLPPSEN
jgi:hypothetical protein